MHFFQVDAALQDNYYHFIAQANIREAIVIDKFLNSVEETEILTNMEMLDIEKYLWQMADINANLKLESESEAENATEKPLGRYPHAEVNRQKANP